MSDIAVKVKDLSILFNLSKVKINSLKEYFVKFVKRELFFEKFWALRNIDFEVRKGEVFGIVGLNGSGKSTLLKVIAGVLKPSHGTVEVFGTVAPLIELGAGFDMELTARENIFLNGAVLGYPREFMKERFNEIVEFSELHEFIDVPIKNYSSGMIARLGFSIATLVRPEILIVDEILSVGDFKFQDKCEKRIEEMMDGGTTVLIVSHTIKQIERLCSRVLYLKKGKMIAVGNAMDVCEMYKQSTN